MHRFVSSWVPSARGRLMVAVFALGGVLIALSALGGQSPEPTSAQSAPGLGQRGTLSAARQPLLFIENKGQFPSEVRYQVFGAGGSLLLTSDAVWMVASAPASPAGSARGAPTTPDAATLANDTVALKLSLPGANTNAQIEPFNRLDTRVSFYTGASQSDWQVDVPVWGGVRYIDIYPGLDLVISGMGGDWQWTLRPRVIQRNSNPFAGVTTPSLQVEGADRVAVEPGGLRLDTAAGALRAPLLGALTAGTAATPAVQQSGRRFTVESPFAATSVNGPTSPAAPQAGAADLIYGTFIGGSFVDEARAIAMDNAGNAYLTGLTFSPGFPITPGVIGQTCPSCPLNSDAFVLKLDANASALRYATFLGGSNADAGQAIAVEGAGAAYVAGRTASSEFPRTEPLDTTCGGCPDNTDAFLVKLTTDGTFTHGTFLGGDDDDEARAIALGGTTLWVGGETSSSDFTTSAAAVDKVFDGTSEGFVAQFSTTTLAVGDRTFLGSTGRDAVTSLSTSVTGDVLLAGGFTESAAPAFASAGAFQTATGGGRDGFVAKLNPALSSRSFATFIGGSNMDEVAAVALDSGGAAYVTGHTYSNNFPTTNGSLRETYNPGLAADAFVVKLNATGTTAEYATYLGGTQSDYGTAIAVDGNLAYVVGTTASTDFPVTGGALQTVPGGLYDGFVVKLNAGGTASTYATYIGGNNDDQVAGIALGASSPKIVYIAGFTRSGNFPTSEFGYDRSHNGGVDAFAAALNINGSPLPPTPTPTPISTPPSGTGQFTIVKHCTGTTVPTGEGAVQCAIGISAPSSVITGGPVQLRLTGRGQARFVDVRATASQLLGTRVDMPANGAQSATITCFNISCPFGPESANPPSGSCDPAVQVPALLNGIWMHPVAGHCVMFIEETLAGVTPGEFNQTLIFQANQGTGFAGLTVNVTPDSGALVVRAPSGPTPSPTPSATPSATPTTIPSAVLAAANCTSNVVPAAGDGSTTCAIGIASTGSGALRTGGPVTVSFGGAGDVLLAGASAESQDASRVAIRGAADGNASISVDCWDFFSLANPACNFGDNTCFPFPPVQVPAPGLPGWNPGNSCVIVMQVVLSGVSAGAVQIVVNLPATSGFAGATFVLTPASGALTVAGTLGGGTVTITGAGAADTQGTPATAFNSGQQMRYTYTLNNTGGSAVQVAVDRFLIGPGHTSVTHHDVVAAPGTTTGFFTELLPPVQRGAYRACLRISHNGTASEASTTFTVDGAPSPVLTGNASCVAVTGVVTLQGRAAIAPAAAGVGPGYSFASVSIPAAGTVPVGTDGSFALFGVPNGTHTLTASAPGYLSAERTGTLVAGATVDIGATQLRAGLVNGDTMVTITDITAMIAAFGTRPADRTANGNVVDINADGVVNILDITLALGNFGKVSPLPWATP